MVGEINDHDDEKIKLVFESVSYLSENKQKVSKISRADEIFKLAVLFAAVIKD